LHTRNSLYGQFINLVSNQTQPICIAIVSLLTLWHAIFGPVVCFRWFSPKELLNFRQGYKNASTIFDRLFFVKF